MRHFKFLGCFSCLLAMLLLCTGIVMGQEFRGRVQGTVTEQTDAAIPGATVTLHNVETDVVATRQTDETGHYLFDFVLPGRYEIKVEAPGFATFVQQNVVVRTTGDVTVNAKLNLGTVAETVTVSAETPAIQFNTSTMSTTVEGEMLRDIPVLARNPFTLALLNPAVVNRYWNVAHRNPFYMWSSNGMDIGGPTGGKNNMLLDGVPLGVSARGSYAPSMDAVQEVVVQQNAVDAQYGFSAGGMLNISMKSGTNDFHGTAYYFGRNPKLNAMTNRINRSESVVRNHIWGGTVGGPILKNKLFFYQSYEQWKSTQPSGKNWTMPTDREKQGDFSQTLNPAGALRPIYDPWTTTFDPVTAKVTRQPFAGNIIPPSRINPASARLMNDLWGPNNPGDDPSGINNFRKTYAWWVKYWNISTRVDYNPTDKIRMYARFSKYQTRLDNPNWGGTIAVPSDNGGLMDALNATMDVLYMISPATTLDIRYSAVYVEDDYDSEWAKVPESVWDEFWPNGWHKPLTKSLTGMLYYPSVQFRGLGSANTGKTGWWQVHARSHNYSVNLTHEMGMHHMKFGNALRYSYDQNGNPWPGYFRFHAIDTADTFKSPNLKNNGSMYASALLGVINNGMNRIRPFFDTHQYQLTFYFQDDITLTRWLTLNLGLRYEYEAAPLEENRILSRELDLTNPIPQFQGEGRPVMPSEVTDIRQIDYKYNGAWIFTDDDNPRMYPAQKDVFLPRIGAAIRINDLTALRIGYARYAVPVLNAHPEGWSLPKYGFDQTSTQLAPLEGKPRTTFDAPYNDANPLRLPVGKARGRYTNLGDSASWYNQHLRTPINDRFSVSLQRQLPWNVAADLTYFFNIGKNIVGTGMWGGDYGLPLNMMDPQLSYDYKGAVDQAVDNPFYGLPATWFPGSLRSQKTVSAGKLLKTYPQYGNLYMRFMEGRRLRYHSFQAKIQRSFSNGFTFLFGYNYSREKKDEWFDALATYANRLEFIDTRQPRHNVRIAGTWEIPIGKGRAYLNNINPVLNAIIGGWATSHIWMYNSGPLLTFGTMQVHGDPKIDNPTYQHWFDTSVFEIQPPYTPRSNPWYFDGLRGPGYWQLDSTLVKYFPITERFKLEFRMEFYNMPNVFMPGNVNTNVNSGNFGKSTSQKNYGREIQYTLRIHF